MRSVIAILVLLTPLLADTALAGPPDHGSAAPTGASATLRIVADPHWTETGMAVSRDGLVVTAPHPAARRARPGEPAPTSGSDGSDRRPLIRIVRESPTMTAFGDPPATGQVMVSTLECTDGSYGTGLFALSDREMIGLNIGTVKSAVAAATERNVAVPSAAARGFYETRRGAHERRAKAAAHPR